MLYLSLLDDATLARVLPGLGALPAEPAPPGGTADRGGPIPRHGIGAGRPEPAPPGRLARGDRHRPPGTLGQRVRTAARRALLDEGRLGTRRSRQVTNGGPGALLRLRRAAHATLVTALAILSAYHLRARDAPARPDARMVGGGLLVGRAVPFGERLRPVPDDDDRAAGDRRRGQRGRRHLDGVPRSGGRRATRGALPASCSRTCRVSTGRCGSRRSARAPRRTGCCRWRATCWKRRRPCSPCSTRRTTRSRTSPRGRPPRPLRLPLLDAGRGRRRRVVAAGADRLPHRADRPGGPPIASVHGATRNFCRPAMSASAARACCAVSGWGSQSKTATRCW